MPNGIETACRGRDRAEEGITQPDDEDSVLLAHSLTSLHSTSVAFADVSAEGKLKEAGYERGNGDGNDGGDTLITMHKGLTCNGDGKCQCYCPEIKSKIAHGEYLRMKCWKQIARSPCKR